MGLSSPLKKELEKDGNSYFLVTTAIITPNNSLSIIVHKAPTAVRTIMMTL